MMNKNMYLLIVLGFIGFKALCQENNNYLTVSLVPWPKDIQIKPETTTPGSQLIFVNSSGNKEITEIIQTCIDDFKATKFTIASSEKEKLEHTDDSTPIHLVLNNNENLGEEGYHLKIDKNISIYANTSTGLFWGTRTLLQLLHKGPNCTIPKLDITDEPAHNYRGLMIDVARHFHTIDFHIQTIKRIASYKLNQYMIHFSDHQSYTLPSDIFPLLPTKGKHYTKEEISMLVNTAKAYHVNVIPSVDVPGHAGALIKGIPDLNFDESFKKVNIAQEESYQILQTLFGEIMELFPGHYWHLGADEVVYPDKEHAPNEEYSAFMEKHNLKHGNQLLNYFINRMYSLVKNKEKEMLVWEGFNPHIEPTVNQEIIVCPFDVKQEEHMPPDYMNAGYKLLNTSWSPLYIADEINMTTPEILAKWTPLMFGAGRSPQPFQYWHKFSSEEIPTEIIGGQICSWNIEEKAQWGLLFGDQPGFFEYGRPGPRIQIFSERIWSFDKVSEKGLLERTGAAYWE